MLFSAVVISLMGDTPESIDPVIVSSCVVLEDQTSETQVDGIVSKVRSCSPVYRLTILTAVLPRLIHLRTGYNDHEIALRDYPELVDSIPSPDGIDIKKTV